jgi:hypothetical protein
LRAQKNILREIFKTSGQSFSILATTATELKNSFFTRKSLKKNGEVVQVFTIGIQPACNGLEKIGVFLQRSRAPSSAYRIYATSRKIYFQSEKLL